jgi:hypothetical protein
MGRALGTQLIEWVAPKAGLKILEERKNLFSYAQFHIRAPGSHITD